MRYRAYRDGAPGVSFGAGELTLEIIERVEEIGCFKDTGTAPERRLFKHSHNQV